MLTDTKLRNLKPKTKLYRVADAGGLCVEVVPNGSRLWRFRFRFGGKAKMLSLGAYPEITLIEARQRRDEARKLLAHGTDPSQQRRIEKMHARLMSATTFQAVADEWLAGREHLADTTRDKVRWVLESFAFPWIGARPIGDITAPELLAVLRRIESLGKLETVEFHPKLSHVSG